MNLDKSINPMNLKYKDFDDFLEKEFEQFLPNYEKNLDSESLNLDNVFFW